MSITLPKAVPNTTTAIAPHLAFTWNEDATRASITLNDTGRAQMNAYVALVEQAVREWPLGQPVLLVHDLTDTSLAFTPFAREKLEEVFGLAVKSPRTGRIATVVHPTAGRGILTVAQNAFARQGTIMQRVFTRHPDAQAWLDAHQPNS